VEEAVVHLSVHTQMPLIVREMQKPDSGLDIRDRNWLKINIPNAFIGTGGLLILFLAFALDMRQV